MPAPRTAATIHRNRPRISTNSHVNRSLNVVSPLLKGADIRELQLALNGLVEHYEFPWHKILVDGEYGKRTARQGAFCSELIGLEQEIAEKAHRFGHLSEHTQHLLRNPEDRTKADREREEKRREHFRKLRHQHKLGLEEAIDFMLAHVGIHESPADSNRGPFPIDACQQHFGLLGVPWCGCLVGYSIEVVALFGDTGVWWPHAGFIRADAEAGRNGLVDINPIQIHRGCPVTFFNGGDDHVGLALSSVGGDGGFDTVEGNTSSLHQDADGGIIERKRRFVSEVTCATRFSLTH